MQFSQCSYSYAFSMLYSLCHIIYYYRVYGHLFNAFSFAVLKKHFVFIT